MTDEKRQKVIERIQLLFNRAESKVENSNNPDEVDHEAQAALEMARKLMIQYGLEMEDIETAEHGRPAAAGMPADSYVVEFKAKRTAKWALMLAVTVADYMNAKVFYSEGGSWQGASLVFYGVKLNAEVAAHAFQSLLNQIRTLSRKHKVTRGEWENSRRHAGLFRRLMETQGVKINEYSSFETYRAAAKREYREGLVIGFGRYLKELKEREAASAEGSRITALAIQYEGIAASWLEQQGIETRERKGRKDRGSNMVNPRHLDEGVQDGKNLRLHKGLSPNSEN